MDKKTLLLESAHDLFVKKGYKDTNISEITADAGIAVGSFYRHFDSKEDIFLQVFIAENETVRKKLLKEINWESDPESIIEHIFILTKELILKNHILSAWNDPSIAPVLHGYLSEDKYKDSSYYQFLSDRIRYILVERKKMSRSDTDKIMKVLELLSYIDIHLDTSGYDDYFESLHTMIRYFVKGVFAEK